MPKKFADTKFGKIEYVESGEGPNVLVFFHGFLGAPFLFDIEKIAERVGPKGYRVLAPYLPGHGKSFMVPPGYKFGDLVGTMREWLDEVALGWKMLIVGHSLGGAIGWEIGMERPATKLMLLDPGLNIQNKPVFSRLAGSIRGNRLDFSGTVFYKPLGLGWKQVLFGPRLMELLTSTKVTRGRFLEPRNVRILWGEADETTSVAEYKDILKLAGVKPEIFPGAHHWFLAHPDIFFSELENFL